MAAANPPLRAGFARACITPPEGVSLAGYFEPRPNRGVLDELYVRACVFEHGSTLGGVVVFDLCVLSDTLRARLFELLDPLGLDEGRLIAAATHTHTGPDLGGVFGGESATPDLVERVAQAAAQAVRQARQDLAPARLSEAAKDENPFAFNRRYWMADGTVVTNPGKDDPHVVRPEGPVDRRVSVLRVDRHGRPPGLLVNLVNHADATGGDLVSADWPGVLEHSLGARLGGPVPVLTLIGCAGNVNHFDPARPDAQTSPQEARRIGEGYADIVARALDRARPLAEGALSVRSTQVDLPFRSISDEEIARAEDTLARAPAQNGGGMTSEDLARGSVAVERFFAEELLAFAREQKPAVRRFPVTALRFGDAAAIVSLPGEPFTEIGLALKAQSPFPRTLVATLAGFCGYVPPAECLARGGYEVLPVRGGGCAPECADRLLAAAATVLAP